MDTEVAAKRPDVVIKNKKREDMHTDTRDNTSGRKCHEKGSRKEINTRVYV
jgi:hypothetical protein